MKKLRLILLLSLVCIKAAVAQQLTLTGTISNAAKHDLVEVNESYDGNYWKKNSVYLKPDKGGNFRISYNYRTAKFVMLAYKGNEQLVLLSPDRNLHVNIDARKTGQMFSFSGKAKIENDLLKKLKLEDKDNISFIKELKSKDSYANWSVDSVINIKFPVIKHSLDSVQRLVHQAVLPLKLKKAIATEVKYFYASAVSLNLGNLLNNRKNRSGFHTRFIDTVLSDFALPTKDDLNVSASANLYLERCFRFKLWKAGYDYRKEKNKERADSIFISNTGVSYKDLENDPDKTNEIYLFSTRMKTILPSYAWEKNLTNLLFNFCMSGQLQSAAKLLYFIKGNCTDRQYIMASEKMTAPLKVARDEYASNLNIKIRLDYKNIASLKALMAPYKGKVVLLDMWGTWCPYCIADMVYNPALKESLKGKDIVFLYLARDEDKDDQVWRDFIFINNLTGEHVRRTADQIAPLWNELGVPDSEQAYPRYFIFDRSGKIMVNNAKRPSDGDALYQQLVAELNK